MEKPETWNLKDWTNDVKLLCQKVLEVLNNNDWPTEEGIDHENYDSPIRMLVERILHGKP